MPNYRQDFGLSDDRVWLNAAHQGAMPLAAAEAAQEAISWKVNPYQMTSERFLIIPSMLKQSLGRLINTSPDDIILGNGNSYGLHLLANGIPWKRKDEVLLLKTDFPSTILPWLELEKRGVVVRRIHPRNRVLQPEDIEPYVSANTRLLCTTWVHSFSGCSIDIEALGALCRDHGITFVVNASQALGVRPLDVSSVPVDAVTSVGWKWLCGPYATGFCWMRPELRESLQYNQAYWLAMQTADDLSKDEEVYLRSGLGARKYDVFGTANFFNFFPWLASLEYVLEKGIESIRVHDDRLVSRFLNGLDPEKYDVLSPREKPARSTLIFFSHRFTERNDYIYHALLQARVYVAFRRRNLRMSPHLYNTEEDIDRALLVLNSI